MDGDTFGTWLKQEIDGRLLTVSGFGRRIGVSRIMIHSWISGRTSPRGPSVVRIARGLGIKRDVIDRMISRSKAA